MNTNTQEIKIQVKEEARILLHGLPPFITSKYNMAPAGVYCLGRWELLEESAESFNKLLADEQETNLHFFPYSSVQAIMIAVADSNKEVTQASSAPVENHASQTQEDTTVG